ncbi:HipA domain-containing protein [Schumannella soli]|uniref:HipA domain-containing protein n=1 Tax=Schumannella soli TaxID=2590779 RepID=UPI0015E86D5B|nr:HipA domain-containing protein [Schumannella soli]
MITELEVTLAGQPVGRLGRRSVEDYVLEYDEAWASAGGAVPLSLSLPLARRRHEGRILADFLDNLLPDNPDVRQRWALDAGLSTAESFGLLSEYGQDVAGAMSFRPAGAEVVSAGESVGDDHIADRIRRITDDPTAWHDDAIPPRGQFSLGGAQDKFSLARFGGGWHETRGEMASTHLFKPRVRGVPDGELVEFVVMRALRWLGVPAAGVSIFDHAETHSLVVERFDRRIDPAGEAGPESRIERLHQEDMLQALGLPRLRRFEKDGGPGADEIGNLLSRTSGSSSREQYATALLLSWILLSTDAHAKNYSIFIDAEKVALTPLYDVSSIVPYLVGTKGTDVASFRSRADAASLAVRYGASDLSGSVGRFDLEHIARRAGRPDSWLLNQAELFVTVLPTVISAAAAELPTRLQTDVVARLVEWMPSRCHQIAEQLGLQIL